MIIDTSIKDEKRQPAGIIALEMLIQRLINGEFAMGQAIRETCIAKEMGLSRNAVREALNQIVGWDVFEYIPYCGYRMRVFSIRDFLEWNEMREAIEPLAARRLARLRPINVIKMLEQYLDEFEKAIISNSEEKRRRADFKFHLTVVENCGNRCFSHMRNICYMVVLFFYDSTLQSELRYIVENQTSKCLPKHFSPQEFESLNMDLTVEMHRKMLEYIKNGNAEEAESCFRTHTANQVRNLENIIMYYNDLTKRRNIGEELNFK